MSGDWRAIEAGETLFSTLGDFLFALPDAVEDLGTPLFVGSRQMMGYWES